MDVFAVEAFAASWIEIKESLKLLERMTSKPLRLRGLKSYLIKAGLPVTASKPLRLRGLKFGNTSSSTRMNESKPLRLRGLKLLPEVRYQMEHCRSLCGFVD